MDVRNAQGGSVDWKDLSNYQILTVSSDERECFDEIAQGKLNLRRELRLGGNPAALQVSGSYNRRTIEIGVTE